MMSKGFTDKLYWRKVDGVWHCLKRTYDEGAVKGERYSFMPLCGYGVGHRRSGGQLIARPPVAARCPRCDGLEMDRRGAVESMPETKEWKNYN